MKTVLVAWEQGRGLGHFGPPLEIADRIVALGGERGIELRCFFALKDPVFARRAAGRSHHGFLAAPRLEHALQIMSHTGSYGDRLAEFGFADVETLAALSTAWDDVFALTRPDLVVADDSPVAMLAARETVPVAAVGSGYSLPPSTLQSFPPLRSRAITAYAEPRLLETANGALKRRGRLPLADLPALLECPVRGVFTAPWLDPYASLRREPVLGPYGDGLGPARFPDRPRILYAALSDQVGVEVLGAAIADSGTPFSAILRGPPSPAHHFLRLRGAEILPEEHDIVAAVAAASVVVSHGVTSVVQQALAIGRPQLIVAVDDETRLLAGQVETLGAGLGFVFPTPHPDADTDAIALAGAGQALRSLLQGATVGRAAAVAEDLARLGLPADPIGHFAGRCLDLMSS